MSPAKFHEYIIRFGFGKRPNSGVAAEATGRVIPPKNWQTIDHANISFGQAKCLEKIISVPFLKFKPHYGPQKL